MNWHLSTVLQHCCFRRAVLSPRLEKKNIALSSVCFFQATLIQAVSSRERKNEKYANLLNH